MKKLFLGIIAVMLLLSIMLPLSVNAASMVASTSEVKEGDIVEIEVKTNQKVKSIQFDLQFDRNEYDYVIDSATSDLEETDSNYIADNMVRVSAFDFDNTATADTVKMKFKAIGSGTGTFKIGAVEIGENGEIEAANKEIEVKVNGVTTNQKEEYLDENGNPLTIGQWGYIPPIRIYGELVKDSSGRDMSVVAYALPKSDDVIKVSDLKAEFGEQINVSGADANGIVGTGDTFELNGNTYTILIYGDVNGDGKVSTADASKTAKNQGKGTLSSVQEEALDVVKIAKNNVDPDKVNALAQQAFILGKQYATQNGTIIDKYPEENNGTLVNGVAVNGAVSSTNNYRHQDIEVTTIGFANVGEIEPSRLTELVTLATATYEIQLNGEKINNSQNDKIAELSYVNNNDGTFTMKLYAAKAGTYTITPIMVGVGVEGGVKRGTPISIEVVENTEVNSVKVTSGDTEIAKDDVVSVSIGKQKELNIEFVHEYTVKQGFNEENKMVPAGEVNLQNVTVEKDASYFAAETDLTNNKLIIKPAGTVANNKEVSIKLNNQVIRTIKVDIKDKVAEKGIELNGAKLYDGKTTSITVSADKTTPSNTKVLAGTKKIMNKDIDLLYTVVPIELVDMEDDKIKLTYFDLQFTGDTAGSAKVKIYETADTNSNDLYFTYYTLNENGAYEEINTSSNDYQYKEINAIGIALKDYEIAPFPAQKWDKEKVAQGLTVQYGTTTVNVSLQVWEGGKIIELTDTTVNVDNSINTDQSTPDVTVPSEDPADNNASGNLGDNNNPNQDANGSNNDDNNNGDNNNDDSNLGDASDSDQDNGDSVGDENSGSDDNLNDDQSTEEPDEEEQI